MGLFGTVALAIVVALVPTVTAMIGIIFGRQEARDTRARMDAQFDKVNTRIDTTNARIDKMAADYTQFYGMTTKLEGRVDEISKR